MTDNATKPFAGGSVSEFDKNWQQRKEAQYNHWVKDLPKNQVQVAFRNHWKLFSHMLKNRPHANCLEIGCGRGSLSSYFADAGIDCTLLDTSGSVLETARKIYAANGHKASFVEANAMAMPFPDNSFDVVTSIGLMEHFEDVVTPLHEQIRVLKPGGTCFAYIVPERPENVQKNWNWLNRILKKIANLFTDIRKSPPKTILFRSDFGSERYLPALEGQPVTGIAVCGMYPLPMISHSPEFPFSLLPKPLEWLLARVFEFTLWVRKLLYKDTLFQGNPWTCREELGQAFLLTFRKAQQ